MEKKENIAFCHYCGVKINKTNFGGMFFRGIVLDFMCSDLFCRSDFQKEVADRDAKRHKTLANIMVRNRAKKKS